MNMIILTAFGILCVVCAALFAVEGAAPAGVPPRVVVQVNVEGDEHWDAVLNNVENLREAFGPEHTQVAVIVHGKGLGMAIAASNKHADRMKTLADGGVSFIACENTMKRKRVSKDQLLPFVSTVDSGVAEVVRRQEQGWSYLRP